MTESLGGEDGTRQRLICQEHDLTVTQYFGMTVGETAITGWASLRKLHKTNRM